MNQKKSVLLMKNNSINIALKTKIHKLALLKHMNFYVLFTSLITNYFSMQEFLLMTLNNFIFLFYYHHIFLCKISRCCMKIFFKHIAEMLIICKTYFFRNFINFIFLFLKKFYRFLNSIFI